MNDIILVTVDSLRADHCGWLSGGNLTPTLDELAAESLTFSSAISPGPRTLSSVPVTHSGVPFPITNHDTDEYGQRVARIRNHITRFETISETLQETGYTTVAFTANPWTSSDNGFDIGFDQFNEVGRSGGKIQDMFDGTPLSTPASLFDHWIYKDTWFSQWRTFYDDIIDTIDRIDEPVFAWVFLLDTHNPYLVPRADREESSAYSLYSGLLRANDALNQTGGMTMHRPTLSESTLEKIMKAYRDSVRSVDAFVERLLEDIDDDTLLVFHSDHGEAFGEHGTYGHEPVLYEENIHVPLLLYNVDTTGTATEPVSTATIPHMISVCARGELLDPSEVTTEYAVARTEADDAVTLRGERWKYLVTDEREWLFDLSEDPDETTDVSDEYLDVVSSLKSVQEEYFSEAPDPRDSSDSVKSEDMKEHLESLGYL